MWNVEPTLMCRKHLFGEHVETHMFAGTMKQHKSIDGYIKKGLVETNNLQARHDILAIEIERRGYSHKSPLIISSDIIEEYKSLGKVDISNSLDELAKRCESCHTLQNARVR